MWCVLTTEDLLGVQGADTAEDFLGVLGSGTLASEVSTTSVGVVLSGEEGAADEATSSAGLEASSATSGAVGASCGGAVGAVSASSGIVDNASGQNDGEQERADEAASGGVEDATPPMRDFFPSRRGASDGAGGAGGASAFAGTAADVWGKSRTTEAPHGLSTFTGGCGSGGLVS